MLNWYVINTKPRKEAQVEKLFQEGGFEIYCPKHRSEGQVKPFFPGYSFLAFEFPGQYQTVKYTRGVKRVVGNDDGPVPLPGEIIRGLKARESDGLIVLEQYGREPRVGDDIEVMEGPLKGLKGVFQKEAGDRERVMILLNYVSYQGMLLIEKRKLKKA
ncbi:MAG: transcription termination/antitermination NusG family protein [Acidobacteriota bacterium]